MLCLRKAGLRVLRSAPVSVPARSRPITTLITSNPRLNATRILASPLQRRWASEDLTQSEPTADRETEAQHGDNSIAKSSQGSAPESAPIESSDQNDSATVAEAVKSAADNATYKAAAAASEALTGSFSPAQVDPVLTPQEPTKTVYVGNLFFDIKVADLEKDFSKAGKVLNAKIIHDARGLSKGFGYIEYETQEEAEKAIAMFNMQPYEGRRLAVQFTIQKAKGVSQRFPNRPPREPHAPTRTLFIGNMAFDLSDRDLNNLFREVKNVTDVRVAIDRRTGQPRGFAHADFVDIASAERAMAELSGKEVHGRALRVDFSASSRISEGSA